MLKQIDSIITAALHEDIPNEDLTSKLIVDEQVSECIIIANESGILSGVKIMKRVFELIDSDIFIKVINNDGTSVEEGDLIAILSGKTKSILKGERVALNLLVHMSSIATSTNTYVRQIKNDHTMILDTRETTPNLRVLDKLAVVDGGGINHTFNLSDQTVIRDVHIKIAGGITKAVSIVKSKIDHNTKIEVDVSDYNQFLEASVTDCDIINLKNLDISDIRRCVINNKYGKLLIADGAIKLNKIQEIAETEVDFISINTITNSIKAMDISLKYN